MNAVKVGAVEYITAENIAVPHCFTTRLGGVSGGYLGSMNLGMHRGDNPENVLENYRRLAQAVGFDPRGLVLTKQVHTDTVRVVDESHAGAGLYAPELEPCDGLVTNTPGLALAVFTADCTPVLLFDPVTGAVGAVHAGWRGTALQIAPKAVELMQANFGCRARDMVAAIGPNIGQCCFETDADVPQAMEKAFGSEAMAFVRTQGEKYYVNLKGLNALALRRAGVEKISLSGDCTACQPERFWSHRRVGANRGSQAGIIVCREAGL